MSISNEEFKDIKLLDVSLREAPTFYWGSEYIKKTVSMLEKAGVDIIEVAFLGDTSEYSYVEGSTHVNTIEQANSLIKNKKEGVLYTVCVNGSSYDIDSIRACESNGIDAIRYVLMENKFEEELSDLRLIKSKGYRLMIQHRNVISYSDDEILRILEEVNDIKPFAYSIVDTNGSMYPADLRRIYELVCSKLSEDIYFGFHGHDNHNIATSNAEYFLELSKNRKHIFVDGSVMGVGIGAGNAKTELLALYMNRFLNKCYDINSFYDIIDDIIPSLRAKCTWGYDGVTLITGHNNALVSHGQFLYSHLKNPRLKKINLLISEMPVSKKYINNFEYWANYDAEFVKKRKRYLLIFLRRVLHSRTFYPFRKIYMKWRYGR